MVRVTEEAQPPPEVTEWFPGDLEAEVYDADHYKAFLKGQLEVFLPTHDQAQDELIQLLPYFLFLPEDASEEKKRIYEEVCAKKARMVRLQRERDALIEWFMTFLTDEIPHVSQDMHEQCQEKVKRFYTGKARFYRTCRHVHKLLYKLHSTSR